MIHLALSLSITNKKRSGCRIFVITHMKKYNHNSKGVEVPLSFYFVVFSGNLILVSITHCLYAFYLGSFIYSLLLYAIVICFVLRDWELLPGVGSRGECVSRPLLNRLFCSTFHNLRHQHTICTHIHSSLKSGPSQLIDVYIFIS